MNTKNKPNGHAALLARGGRANGGAILSSGMGRAASVDASELSVANAAASITAAGAEREAYAEVAQVPGEGKQSPAAGAASRSPRPKSGNKPNGVIAPEAQPTVPPGLDPLPVDGEAFVDAVHSRVDLVALEETLLKSKDEKIVQRELAYLRELRYGKHAPPPDDDVPQIIVDMQRPERDMP
jgi:hypothetical protein